MLIINNEGGKKMKNQNNQKTARKEFLKIKEQMESLLMQAYLRGRIDALTDLEIDATREEVK